MSPLFPSILSLGVLLGGAVASASAQTSRESLNQLSAKERAEGWQLLFDGKTTAGWRAYRQNGFPAKGWEIADQALHVMAGGGGGDIMPLATYEDFDFLIDWRVAPRANSGVMYRVREDEPQPWKTGPEYQIFDDAGHPGVGDRTSAGSLYALYAPEGKKIVPTGEYNRTRIKQVGDHVEHWLNGVKVLEADLSSDDWKARVARSKFKAFGAFGRYRRGYLALQDHGNDVWFRNIKIRDLSPPQPAGPEIQLFNGKDLAGWKAILRDDTPAAQVWSVDSQGILICRGRPAGYIRTEADHTSYILKVEWRFKPGSKGGNSGVLLRLHGADRVWPRSIEAQLQSGNAGDFWNIDKFPMKVTGWRTKGRNTKKTHMAEKPIGEWNVYEIIADGGHIVLKVNGQVLNEAWEAEAIPGKIGLQSEGAEIHFRRVSLTPLRSRGAAGGR